MQHQVSWCALFLAIDYLVAQPLYAAPSQSVSTLPAMQCTKVAWPQDGDQGPYCHPLMLPYGLCMQHQVSCSLIWTRSLCMEHQVSQYPPYPPCSTPGSAWPQDGDQEPYCHPLMLPYGLCMQHQVSCSLIWTHSLCMEHQVSQYPPYPPCSTPGSAWPQDGDQGPYCHPLVLPYGLCMQHPISCCLIWTHSLCMEHQVS
jgi:hypothetical protein